MDDNSSKHVDFSSIDICGWFQRTTVAREISEETQSLTTGVVKATQGEVTEAKIVWRLQELAPGEFQWELVALEDNVFRVDFPSVDDL